MKFGWVNIIKRSANETPGGNGETPKPEGDTPASDGLDGLPELWRNEIVRLRAESADKRNRLKALEDAKAADETKRQKDEQDKLAEQGNWKALAEQRAAELEAANKKAALADEFLKDITERNTARVAKLPELAKKLMPEGLEPRAVSKWLDVAEETFAKPQAPDLDGGKTGDRNKPEVKASDYYKSNDF